MSESKQAETTSAGFVGVSVLRLILLMVVLTELTFLSSRFGMRVDLTSDQIYTLTDSTKTVLDSLTDKLIIEAYFSPDESLPINYRPARVKMRNTLQEYVELSEGKIHLQYFDPFADRTVRETAERLGIRPQESRTSSSGRLTATEVWQGFRIRYGAEKQEVVPLMRFGSTYNYEAVLTPLIKRLTIKQRPKIGVLAFRSSPGSGGMVFNAGPKAKPQGFGEIMRMFSRAYDFRPIEINQGQLIPDELDTVLLVRPKHLSDRTKFVFDQFLMRGGKLVVFADSVEVEIRQDREFRGKVPGYDGPTSKLKFIDQLRHYGIVVEDRIVGEGVRQLHQNYGQPLQNQQFHQYMYPYMFEAADQDWATEADKFAAIDPQDPSKGVNQELAEQLRKLFKPGVNLDHDLTKAIASAAVPGFFWPCPVGVAEPLPPGVAGEVLLRSSPLSWKELPNIDLDPFVGAPDMQQRMLNLDRWRSSKINMLPVRNPVQTPLMAHVTGEFTSFFKGQKIPPKPQTKKPNKPAEDPSDWGDDEEKKKKPGQQGPEPAKKLDDSEPEETMLAQATRPGSLLVIGDATFIRDDFIRGAYSQLNQQNGVVGPSGRTGGQAAMMFFRNLLDWLAQERDLLKLQNKVGTNRSMTLLTQNEAQGETDAEFRQRIGSKTIWLASLNAFVPAGLFMILGLCLWSLRRSRKRAFLSQL